MTILKQTKFINANLTAANLGFTNKLMNSPEIRILANLVACDAGSVTGSNLIRIEEEFGLDPWVSNSSQLAGRYKCYDVPAVDEWRLPLLVKMLDQRCLCVS